MAIRADLAVLPEGDRIRISVEDRGPGISPADLPHIFEPFYRGTCAQTDDVSGLGLGLTLVKRVVEAHLGKIAVASSQRGTSFTILLRPWYDRKSREEPQP